jgi:hypothetical protein
LWGKSCATSTRNAGGHENPAALKFATRSVSRFRDLIVRTTRKEGGK